ncbi:hypothetical protein ON010_g9086 [Phytophthora cinnamomi]|nr:hypothetical protein ON010_g9086 [Phytophthora cinnamomi]
MSRLSSDDVIDAIAELHPPVTLRFRRPVAYRKYLATFFSTKKELASQSIAKAMFPPTPEYKKKAPKQSPKKVSNPGSLVSQSFIEPETASFSPKKAAPLGNENEERAREFKAFAEKIGALDQFKLWSGGESPTGGRPLAGHQSAFLTEKHMHRSFWRAGTQREFLGAHMCFTWEITSYPYMKLHRSKIEPLDSPRLHLERAKTNGCTKAYHRLLSFWHWSQIGHSSEYSVERMLAFQDYYDRTPVCRVLAVCVLTPVPGILLTFLVDCIPLRDPSEGWKANYAFWIRELLDGFVIAMGAIAQVRAAVLPNAISNTGAIVVAVGVAVICTLLSIGLAATWRFPIPFGLVILVVPHTAVMSTLTFLIIGPRVISKSPLLSAQLKAQGLIGLTQGVVAMAYPLFTAIFYRLSGIQQTAFVFTMPLLKFAAKAMIAKASGGLHCYVGMLVVFSVDVFNVLYIAICMQFASSTTTTVAMISLDGFHVIIGVRAIFHQINIARKRRLSSKSAREPSADCFGELSTMMNKLLRELHTSNDLRRRIRVFAPFPLPLSDDRATMLNEMARLSQQTHAYPSPKFRLQVRGLTLKSISSALLDEITQPQKLNVMTGKHLSSPFNAIKHNQIVPVNPGPPPSALRELTNEDRKVPTPRRLLRLLDSNMTLSTGKVRAALSYKATETAVWDILQALFHAEYLLIAEYIECALPMLFKAELKTYHAPEGVVIVAQVVIQRKCCTNKSIKPLMPTISKHVVLPLIMVQEQLGAFGAKPLLGTCVSPTCRTFWHLGQIGHRSEYSVERLLALRDYSERTSITRALVVCFTTPLPAILASILIDCIPLRDPSEGWKANYAFWIRDLFDTFLVSLGGVTQTQAMTMDGSLSNTGVVTSSLGTAVVYVLLKMGVAATWRFPVPFGMIFLVGPFVTIITIFTLSTIGPNAIANSSILQGQLKAHAWIVFTQGVVAMAYPLFTEGFYRLSRIQQTAFVFILPVIKFTAKTVIAKAAAGSHEYVGMLVVLSVDVFNVIYVAICMQISKSMLTTVLMISLDCIHVTIGVRAIFHQVNIARKRRVSRKSITAPSTDCFEDFPTITSRLLQQFRASKTPSSRIRVNSPFPLPLSVSSASLLSELSDINRQAHVYPVPRSSMAAKPELCELTEVKLFSSTPHSSKRSQVAPANSATLRFELPSSSKIPFRKGSNQRRVLALMDANTAVSAGKLRAALSHKAMETAVCDILQALFHAEYLLVAEYVECALPMLYALYLLVLSQLPTAQYYPQTAVPFHKLLGSVTNILIFAVVEFVGFVGLLLALQKKFKVSPLYQLAFVLETHIRTVQGHLLLWTVFILRMALKHQGVASDIHLEYN